MEVWRGVAIFGSLGTYAFLLFGWWDGAKLKGGVRRLPSKVLKGRNVICVMIPIVDDSSGEWIDDRTS